MIRPHRKHPLWLAFILHRLSGVALTLFLPVHFLVLSLALTGEAALDEFLRFADNSIFKAVEFCLVFLLAVHMFGGLRILALEWLPWSGPRKTLAATAVAGSFLLSTLFLMQVI
jgi:fumarate reductase subunit D